VPNVVVTWTVSSGSGVLGTATSVTDANGEASNTLTPTSPSVTVAATISSPGFSASVTFGESANPPLRVITIFSGNNQAGTIGAPLPAPLVVRVTQDGVPVSGQLVSWTISSGSGTLGSATSVTDSAGLASNTLTPTGPSTAVTASIPGGSVTFNE